MIQESFKSHDIFKVFSFKSHTNLRQIYSWMIQESHDILKVFSFKSHTNMRQIDSWMIQESFKSHDIKVSFKSHTNPFKSHEKKSETIWFK